MIDGEMNGKIKWKIWNNLMESEINDPWPNESWNRTTKTFETQPTFHTLKQKTSQDTPATSSCSAHLKQSQLRKQIASLIQLAKT